MEALSAADGERVGGVEAVGLDETLSKREGRRRTRRWGASIVDVQRGQLLDIVPGRDAAAPKGWLLGRPEEWRKNVDWASDLTCAVETADSRRPRRGGPFRRR